MKDAPHVFAVSDFDGNICLAEAPHESNGQRPRIIAKFKDNDAGHEALARELTHHPCHVWL